MKFSVLLPTRNRLDLLTYAIETVRKQDYDDWEIIVSDNCSDDNVGGFILSLNDPRIKYFRTDCFVPVTKNWNRALDKSDGDYVIMLGDDDCLMQGYFSTIRGLAEQYKMPDFIYTSAFLYAYPGVMPFYKEGFVQPYGYADFLQSAKVPFLLQKQQALKMLRYSLNFKVRFGYNMQFSIVSRSLIDTLKKYGEFYQSPYPDYYASNAMLLKADRILVVPEPLVTIGISPKSFGAYYFNDMEKQGNAFLQNLPDEEMAKHLDKVILPGTNMNTSWLLSMETLRTNFGDETELAVNYRRYRLLQMLAVAGSNAWGKQGRNHDILQKLNAREKLFYCIILIFMSVLAAIFPERYRASLINRIVGAYPRFSPPKIPGTYKTILDVFERLSSERTDEK